MSVSTGLVQLHAALKTVRTRLEFTRAGWDDAVRREFEEQHWAPLEDQVRSALIQMERLSHVLIQAKQETS